MGADGTGGLRAEGRGRNGQAASTAGVGSSQLLAWACVTICGRWAVIVPSTVPLSGPHCLWGKEHGSLQSPGLFPGREGQGSPEDPRPDWLALVQFLWVPHGGPVPHSRFSKSTEK